MRLRGQDVSSRRHVKHSNAGLLVVAQELNDFLSDTLCTTSDNDDIILVVDGVTLPLLVVARVSVQGAVDRTNKEEDPNVADPFVLREEKRPDVWKKLGVCIWDIESGVLVLVVEDGKRGKKSQERRRERDLVEDAKDRIKGEWLAELGQTTAVCGSCRHDCGRYV